MKARVFKIALVLLAACFLFSTCYDPVAAGRKTKDQVTGPETVIDPVEPPEPVDSENPENPEEPEPPADPIITDWDALTAAGGKVINIKLNTVYQEMNGFGASDCWDGNWVGQSWSTAQKEQISNWLFSQDFDGSGQPKGIGLSMWRVNLGGGSFEQGSASKIGITNYSASNQKARWDRRAESFLKNINDPGQGYDWTKQAGQQYFFKKAKDMGTEILIAFSNSPLIPWTKSGTAVNAAVSSTTPSSGKYTKYGDSANLKDDNYDEFAGYLADVADHFAGEGYPFKYISPVNEPQWDWNEEKQEGSPWTNADITKLVKELDTAIQARPRIAGADGAKIMIGEAAKWDFASGATVSGYTGRKDQIWEFFSPSHANYIGNLTSMKPNIYAGHTYYTHKTDAVMKSSREKVKSQALLYGDDADGVDIYSSEWCMLADGGVGGDGLANPDTASYFDIAMYMAKLIHADITIANAKSWSFWTAMDLEQGGKDRYTLIGLSPGSSTYDRESYNSHPITDTGSSVTMPTLWALGNYSLFVRPGFKRIALVGDGINANNGDGGIAATYMGLMGTAYKSPAGYKDTKGKAVDRVVAVWVNFGSADQTVASKFDDNRNPVSIRTFITDASNTTNTGYGPGLRKGSHDNGIITIPARSIYTVVYDF